MTDSICVFISYKREDQAVAESLSATLHQWGYATWLDVKDIQSGISEFSETWKEAIHKGLKRSHVLIGLITPDSLSSRNVRQEWDWAYENSRRILLLRLRPFDKEDMPPSFIATDYIDLQNNEATAFARLQRELEAFGRERDGVKQTVTPPELDAKPTPLVIPPYLLATIPRQREGDLIRSRELSDVEQMRQRVYQYWVQGVMQTALKEVKAAAIKMDMQPDAVVRDTRKNVGDITLPNDSRHVRQVYDTFKSFLILGAPGAGKTIMLLQLAESLILKPPPTMPDAIPLVLNLSSWALTRKPLHEWLEDETWRTYRVRGNRVRGWLSNNQLILLLDGLDEVKEEQRAACVEMINAFRTNKAYALVPLVVCSRILDYERLGEMKLALPGAIFLEALSAAQVDRYLSDPELAHLKRVVETDAILRDMTTTPFLLNTMIYAYRHEPEDALRGLDTEATRREHLFNTYVLRRLKDAPRATARRTRSGICNGWRPRCKRMCRRCSAPKILHWSGSPMIRISKPS